MDAVDLILNLQEQEERNKCRKDNSGQLVYRQSVDTCVTFTREELFGWEKGGGDMARELHPEALDHHT